MQWLFSSVIGNRPGCGIKRPGDLYGIDADGDLIIVEAKTCGPGRPHPDPFVNFVGPARALVSKSCLDCHVPSLDEQWTIQLAEERDFGREHLVALESGVPLLGIYPGILPYSCHRASLRVWRDVYRPHILPFVTGSRYEATVLRYLNRRHKRRNPAPHFVALLAGIGGIDMRLSRRGDEHMGRLSAMAPGRVHVVGITASVDKRKRTTTFTSESMTGEATMQG
jgi:hypothetical protein